MKGISIMDDLAETTSEASTSWLATEAELHPEMLEPLQHLDQIRTRLYQMDGHLVRIRTVAGHDSLNIDGRPETFRVNRAGFVLDSSGYSRPAPTLLEAAAGALHMRELPAAPVFDRLAPLDYGERDTHVLPCGRPNFTSLGLDGRFELAEALNTLEANGTVEEFVREHRAYSAQIHGGPSFLPWHRDFLLRFEAELRRVDPQVRLPYWDWARTFIPASDGNPAQTIELTNDLQAEPWKSFFGGRANSGGFFDHWNITRGPSVGASAIPTVPSVVSDLTAPDFLRFRDIEGAHHGGVHNWVGGTMANPATSPRDPLFFLHHANVDRLWAMWQRNHPDAAQYTLDNLPNEPDSGDAFVPIDEPMPGGATPRSMLDHTSLEVVYSERDSRVEEQVPGFLTVDETRRLGPLLRDIFFGKVVVGDTRFRNVTLRNTGSLSIRVEIARHDGQISWPEWNGRIQPCRTAAINVMFTPTGTGPVQEDLIVKTNARGRTRTVRISGTGIRGNVP